LNLDAEPRATVQLGSRTMTCVARRLGNAEADRYWDRLVEVWPAHETYLKRSGRRHTFMLTPDMAGPRRIVPRAAGAGSNAIAPEIRPEQDSNLRPTP
jgi:F420H(2)-dependent quinone reductase